MALPCRTPCPTCLPAFISWRNRPSGWGTSSGLRRARKVRRGHQLEDDADPDASQQYGDRSNNKLSQSVITNYNLPEQKMVLQVPVNVSYVSDPDHVERVLLEEARKPWPRSPGCWTILRHQSGSSPVSASHLLRSAYCAISRDRRPESDHG